MPDISFTEKELEDFLCSNNNLRRHLGLRLITRQYRTPVGVVDLIAYNNNTKRFVVVELKKGALDSNAYLQLERYRHYFTKKAYSDYEKKNPPLTALSCPREFDCLLIGNTLAENLNYVVNYWDDGCSLSDYSRVWYRCFDYSLERAICFDYYSPEQREVEYSDYE